MSGLFWASRLAAAAGAGGLEAAQEAILAGIAAQPGVLWAAVVGRTAAGATVTVDGTAVKVLPDGSFSEYVRHGGKGEVVVRATFPDGQFTEQSRPVSKR